MMATVLQVQLIMEMALLLFFILMVIHILRQILQGLLVQWAFQGLRVPKEHMVQMERMA